MVTHTLGQSVWENCALFFFTREVWGAFRVRPHSGRGDCPQLHVCCRSVDWFLLAFFLVTLKERFTNVCTCARLRICLLHCMHASSFALTF